MEDVRLKVLKDTLLVKICGEIDDRLAVKIRKEVDFALERKEVINIIFDLTNVGFMDSAGIGLLLGRYNIVNEKGGDAYVLGCNKGVRRILDMVGVMSIYKEYERKKEYSNA